MIRLTCDEALARLDAFHDGELPLPEQVAVQKHVQDCLACAVELDDLRVLKEALQLAARNQLASVDLTALAHDESRGFQATVLTRIKTERSLSLATSVRVMFEDMRLVYAGMAATIAAATCVLMLLNMTRLFADQRPDSLAARVHILAAKGGASGPASLPSIPGVPVVVDARLLAASSFGPIVAADSDSMMRDAEYALRAVVTRDGRVTNVELLHARSGQPVDDPEIAVFFSPLVRAVSRARFEPASVDGLPVASNVVLNVPHTTVRPAKEPVVTAATARSRKNLTLGAPVSSVRA